MAKSKTKKKYTPRPIFYPRMVVAQYTFEPFIEALEGIIERGEILLDQNGTPIYIDTADKPKSYESSLRLYKYFLETLASRREVTIDTSAFDRLMTVLETQDEIEEADIQQGRKVIEMMREIVAKVPLAESQDILKTVRSRMELKRVRSPLQKETNERL